MITLGRFLELGVPAPDIRASLDFYRRLGFAELPVNDVRSWYYAVVTDGVLCLGLHGGGLEGPALTFVLPGLKAKIGPLQSAGLELTGSRLGDDEFNEASFTAAEAASLLLVEARTFSPGLAVEAPVPLPGPAREIAVRTRDLAASLAFWSAAGFTAGDPEDEPVALRGDALPRGLALGLHRSLPGTGVAITYRLPAVEVRGLAARLAERDIQARREGEGLVLRGPEGTTLRVLPGEGD